MKSIVKGAPSGFMVSLLIHAAAFMLAGMLVVFNVVKKEEKKFVPPEPVERPKMKLKKPKVKVKKTAKPKSTQRIVTKVKRASMPDIQLPEMSGIGDGLGGDIGGFDIMPDLGEVTLFGGGQSIGNDLVGTFYDFKRSRTGRPLLTSEDEFVADVTKFVQGGWKTSRLAKYYRSPNKLYATSLMVPTVPSYTAPTAFGEPDTKGYAWMVHYKGQLTYHEDIKFRFWGCGDDILVVRVDGEIVLNACWPNETYTIGGGWISSAKNDFRFYLGNNLSRGGDWIELKAGEAKSLEVIMGEVPGGGFCSMLTVEVEGVEYPRNRQGGPIHPIFKTEEPSWGLKDVIYADLITGEATLEGGPVFRDYQSKVEPAAPSMEGESEVVAAESVAQDRGAARLWAMRDGSQFEGEYVALLGDKLVLKDSRGRQKKVSISSVSPEDMEYIELSNPPDFSLDFVKLSSAVMDRYQLSPKEIDWGRELPRVNDYTFGAKVRQTGARPYNHELELEYFALAQEHSGNAYVLMDHGSSSFTPSEDNERSHAFRSDREIEFRTYVHQDVTRGIKFAESLVLLKDKRGKVVEYKASSPWLWEHLAALRQLPIGAYLNDECQRIHPTPQKPTRY